MLLAVYKEAVGSQSSVEGEDLASVFLKGYATDGARSLLVDYRERLGFTVEGRYDLGLDGGLAEDFTYFSLYFAVHIPDSETDTQKHH